jgi:hypothetical protein
MTIKKYHEFERKLDKYLFDNGIFTEYYIRIKEDKIIIQAERIINPQLINGTKTKPKGSD